MGSKHQGEGRLTVEVVKRTLVPILKIHLQIHWRTSDADGERLQVLKTIGLMMEHSIAVANQAKALARAKKCFDLG